MSTERPGTLGPLLFWLLAALLVGALSLRLLGFVKAPPARPAPTAGLAVAETLTAAADLDLRPIWDNLPETWRAEAEGAVEKLRASANPELWLLGFHQVERLAELLALPAERATGLDQSARLAALLEDSSDMLASEAVRRARLRLAAGLRTIVHSGLDDPDNLAYLDLRELCHSFLPNVEAELRKLEGQASASLLSPERVAELRGLSAAGRAAESDVTRFEWTAPTGAGGDLQRTSEIECMQLEGCWVEGNLVAIVPAWLAAVDRELALWTAAPGSKEAMYARGMLEALDSGLGELERAAQDPIGFDAALDALMGALVSRAVRHKVSGPFD